MIVGLTGGMGSGKSTVAKFFVKLGVPVYDSDKEAKLLMRNDPVLQKKIIALFGKKAYVGGEINRQYIASTVFSDPEMLQRLNAIVHPAVRGHFLQWEKKQHLPYVIQETALIFENRMQAFYDAIILVTAPVETRVQRVISRDSMARNAVLQRMKNQMDDGLKKTQADFVLENLSLATTWQNVKDIHRQLLRQVL